MCVDVIVCYISVVFWDMVYTKRSTTTPVLKSSDSDIHQDSRVKSSQIMSRQEKTETLFEYLRLQYRFVIQLGLSTDFFSLMLSRENCVNDPHVQQQAFEKCWAYSLLEWAQWAGNNATQIITRYFGRRSSNLIQQSLMHTRTSNTFRQNDVQTNHSVILCAQNFLTWTVQFAFGVLSEWRMGSQLHKSRYKLIHDSRDPYKQVSATAEGSARRAASRRLCCMERYRGWVQQTVVGRLLTTLATGREISKFTQVWDKVSCGSTLVLDIPELFQKFKHSVERNQCAKYQPDQCSGFDTILVCDRHTNTGSQHIPR